MRKAPASFLPTASWQGMGADGARASKVGSGGWQWESELETKREGREKRAEEWEAMVAEQDTAERKTLAATEREVRERERRLDEREGLVMRQERE